MISRAVEIVSRRVDADSGVPALFVPTFVETPTALNIGPAEGAANMAEFGRDASLWRGSPLRDRSSECIGVE